MAAQYVQPKPAGQRHFVLDLCTLHMLVTIGRCLRRVSGAWASIWPICHRWPALGGS
jgi:hypothetical protein